MGRKGEDGNDPGGDMDDVGGVLGLDDPARS